MSGNERGPDKAHDDGEEPPVNHDPDAPHAVEATPDARAGDDSDDAPAGYDLPTSAGDDAGRSTSIPAVPRQAGVTAEGELRPTPEQERRATVDAHAPTATEPVAGAVDADHLFEHVDPAEMTGAPTVAIERADARETELRGIRARADNRETADDDAPGADRETRTRRAVWDFRSVEAVDQSRVVGPNVPLGGLDPETQGDAARAAAQVCAHVEDRIGRRPNALRVQRALGDALRAGRDLFEIVPAVRRRFRREAQVGDGATPIAHLDTASYPVAVEARVNKCYDTRLINGDVFQKVLLMGEDGAKCWFTLWASHQERGLSVPYAHESGGFPDWQEPAITGGRRLRPGDHVRIEGLRLSYYRGHINVESTDRTQVTFQKREQGRRWERPSEGDYSPQKPGSIRRARKRRRGHQ